MADALRAAIDDALRKLSPRSEMAKAVCYGVKLWPALTRFLDDGRLEIDNGVAERALRGVAVRRRNWLFAGSLAGGERAAALYSVIETAKANGVEPQAYIADVLGGRMAAEESAAEYAHPGVRSLHLQLAALHEKRLDRLVSIHSSQARLWALP